MAYLFSQPYFIGQYTQWLIPVDLVINYCWTETNVCVCVCVCVCATLSIDLNGEEDSLCPLIARSAGDFGNPVPGLLVKELAIPGLVSFC